MAAAPHELDGDLDSPERIDTRRVALSLGVVVWVVWGVSLTCIRSPSRPPECPAAARTFEAAHDQRRRHLVGRDSCPRPSVPSLHEHALATEAAEVG